MNSHEAPVAPAPSAAEPGQALKLRILPDARFSRTAREELRAFAGGLGIGRSDLEEFIFAVGEALANAIEHSRSAGVIEVRCDYEGDKIVATVIDSGDGFKINPLASVVIPDAFAERGRGLAIMRRCTDIFAVHSVPGRGTAIVLGRYVRRGRSDQEQSMAS
ncbi:MAG TPA: ATP-binding protein [Candidatus Baltobacteraceae bacterium]|nr:ATP-binding protein [Candidatus Baltobacteraceae bacterium]